MGKRLDAICIPSGGSDEIDINRVERAIKFNKRLLRGKVPYLILGAGPDLNSVLGYTNPVKNPDHHLAMYDYLLKNTNETIGLDINSITSVENIIDGFPNNQKGRYAIVTEPWHYKKFETIIKNLKKKERISKDLEFFNVPVTTNSQYNLTRKILSWINTGLELRKI